MTQASNPNLNVYVSASAGTGKTKTLIDRLLRLLLRGTPPQSILCITFTKAAAQEMIDRLLTRLEALSLMTTDDIIQELKNLDEEPSPSKIELSQNLFEILLDNKIKIQTLHAFCQSLIEHYVWDLGFIPPLTIIDDVEKNTLIMQALNEQRHIPLCDKMGYSHFLKLLKQSLSLKTPALEKSKTPFDSNFDFPLFREKVLSLPIEVPTDPDELTSFFLTKTGDIRKKIVKKETLDRNPGLEKELNELADLFLKLEDHKKILTLNDLNEAFFDITLKTKLTYESLKKRQSKVDFDDLIDLSLDLLTSYKSGEIEKKLGYAIKAILVDEAQDISIKQWALIDTLIQSMIMADDSNTFFIVGDLKQSIYGFQGASPECFLEKPVYLEELCNLYNRPFLKTTLKKSYRSTPAVLQAVDDTFKTIFPSTSHIPHREDAQGKVQLHNLISKEIKDVDWQLPHLRSIQEPFARYIVTFLENLLHSNIELPSTQEKIKPQDIMILVRNRGTLVHDLTKLCYKKNIPISGLDRFKLNDHLMVQDFLAFFSWLLNKEDSYHLACVLKSPFHSPQGILDCDLFTLSQTKNLWEAVCNHEPLKDFVNFCQFSLNDSIHSILMAIWHKKSANFIEVFGNEAIDIFEELYSIAYNLERQKAFSLQEFVWHMYEADLELKRDISSKGYPEVRLMTVHGSKGLQAPIVILADTNIKTTLTKEYRLTYMDRETLKPADKDCPLFLKNVKSSTLDFMNEEENRLLYVAMTRAEDHLYMFGKGEKEASSSWYSMLSQNEFDSITLKDSEVSLEIYNPLSKIPDYFLTPTDLTLLKQSEFIKNEKATARGTLMHKLLEILPYKPEEEWYITGQKLEASKDDIDHCINLIKTNPHLFNTHSKPEFSIIHNGKLLRLDLLVETETECIIVEFKTGKQTQEKTDLYNSQLETYKRAIEELYPLKDVKTEILWIDKQA